MTLPRRAVLIGAPLALATLLMGCAEWSATSSAITSAVSGQVTNIQTNVQQVNDLNAKAWTDVACATSIGELARNGSGNPNFPAAVFLLCWPQHQITLPMPAMSVAPLR